jgi:arylsulfatase A-like enzyme
VRPPNLLFLYTDQQRYDTLAAYGNHRIQMPHLNRLAEQSVVFDQAYCTQPVCTPSRAALQSGLWPHQSDVVTNNLPLPAAIPTLVEMLPDDVATGHFGKWHLGDEIYPQHGYQE